MDEWPELDALVEELHKAHEERWRTAQDLRQQLAMLQPHVEVLSRQFEELQVEAHLRLINERILAGLGSVELVHAGTGIEYLGALVWPAHVHPAEGEAQPSVGEVCRIEVWLGPNLEDGRPRIRIAGERRLEATLPTSPERFRSALLRVFQQPQRVRSPGSEDEESDESRYE